MIGRIRSFLRSRSPFTLVFIPLFVVYVSTANFGTHEHIDPLTNALTGWHLGMSGSVVMSEHAEAATPEYQGNVAWIVDSRRGPVAQYPPAAAALAAPFYALSGEPMTDYIVEGRNRPDVKGIPFPLPSPFPAAIVAALTSASAMGLVAASIQVASGSLMGAVAAGYVGGLGTTFWATASDALWQHGPASMWIALGVYLAARSRFYWSGLAFGAAVLTRPHLALIAAAVGVYIAISRREPRPAVKIAVGSSMGLFLLLWFNWWAWGGLTITGGYSDQMTTRLLSSDLGWYASNVLGGLFDPVHGLITYSPWLLMLIPGIATGWRQLPPWARGAALGGLIYWLVQLKANRFSGGDGFLGYRYPLEALTSAGVLLFYAYFAWVKERVVAARLFWLAVGVSIVPGVLWKMGALPGSR